MVSDRSGRLMRKTLTFATLLLIAGCGEQGAEREIGSAPPQASTEPPIQASDMTTERPSAVKRELARTARRPVTAKGPVGSVTIGGQEYRTVRLKNGAVSLLPPRPVDTTATPAPGCQAKTFKSDGSAHTRLLPPAPKLTAVWTGDRVTVSYAFRGASRECRPAALEVTVDENDDSLPGFSQVVKLRRLHGSVAVDVPEVLNQADVVRASARTNQGLPSESVAVLIR
jgi:hypothetical protein